MEFGDALRLAQDMGYAEADPTADVEGLDAGRKVAILASAAFNSRVTFEDVYTEGITKITATDIEYAKEMGCTIKLLGVAKDTPEGIEARVHPMLIDSNHPLATVNDSYNAVFLTGDAVQDTMFYGRGAGELRLRVPLWAIFSMLCAIFYGTAAAESAAHATGNARSSVSAKLSRNILYACRLKIGMERWHR